MCCEDGEVKKSRAEEPTRPVDCYRAARQFERFMMGVDPLYRLGVDDLGDEHLTPEELMERRVKEVSRQIGSESFGRTIATVTYCLDRQRIEIVQTEDIENSSETNS